MSLTTRQKGVGLAAAVVAAGLLTAGGIWMFSGGGQLVTYPIAPEAEALRNTAYRIEARPLRGEMCIRDRNRTPSRTGPWPEDISRERNT